MKNNESLYLVLGCFGRQDDGFISCKSVENKILKVSSELEGYQNMMDYFSSCRLFDRPVFELNAVRHIIFNLQDKYDQKINRLWSEKNFTLYQKFIIDHRPCGVYVKLILDSENLISQNENLSESKIFIKANQPISYSMPKDHNKDIVLTNLNTKRFKHLK